MLPSHYLDGKGESYVLAFVFAFMINITREQKEKQEAKERYWKAHLAGKTDQAKADLARLARIRKEREEAQAKRKAEAEGLPGLMFAGHLIPSHH